ncbi:HET-domain-containing protein [Microthyrium microscopicum]|uniref:HET-domain-containing protein n=1 Tax=Microthyrium microscopicum TaxID=703497 RepID=A0A6A6TX73_9PEZI|nr:HET-domain-containing protein [Microthyrium microscopicum]
MPTDPRKSKRKAFWRWLTALLPGRRSTRKKSEKCLPSARAESWKVDIPAQTKIDREDTDSTSTLNESSSRREPETKDMRTTKKAGPERFKHSPLPDGKFMRLLRLLPGDFDDPVKCEIITTEFDVAPAYEPISYCWGTAKWKEEITVDGKPFPITISLYDALRHFRRQMVPRILWADGICINQDSKGERGHQVSFMGQIYNRGEQLLIWLGETPRTVDVAGAVNLMKEFNLYMTSEVERIRTISSGHIWEIIYQIPPIPMEHPLMQAFSAWDAIQQLLERPWFTRLWVIQEVGLAAGATAYCGKHEFVFSQIALFAIFYHHMQKFLGHLTYIEYEKVFHALDSVWSTFGTTKSWLNDGAVLRQVKTFHEELNHGGLLVVLYTGRGYHCTEAVDHIYGLLGHPSARVNDANIIEPDYKRAVSESNRLLAENISIKTQSSRLLCYIQHKDVSIKDDYVPTWVPVWNERHRYNLLEPHPDFDASRTRRSNTDLLIEVKGNQLKVNALILDTVVETSDIISYNHKHAVKTVTKYWELHSSAHKNDARDWDYWEDFLWNMVNSYDHIQFLTSDFIAFAREYMDKKITDIFVADPYFASSLEANPNTNPLRFIHQLHKFSGNRRYFSTEGGIAGVGLKPTSKGDKVAIIFGCPMPIMLRPAKKTGQYKVSGQVHNRPYMFGRVVDDYRAGKLKVMCEQIVLV